LERQFKSVSQIAVLVPQTTTSPHYSNQGSWLLRGSRQGIAPAQRAAEGGE